MISRRRCLELLGRAGGALAGAAALALVARRSTAEPEPAAPGRVLRAGPGTYRALLRTLRPGDRLMLEPGVYADGLPLHGLTGATAAPIAIEGPSGTRRAIFRARSGAHTVSIVDSAHIAIRGLYLDGQNLPVDGVRAEGNARWAHHVTLEWLTIVKHGAHQQVVGISTKCPAWGWVIRGNEILGAGTGLYLGDSNGRAPFFEGVVENNVVVRPLGYCMQIKHQHARPAPAGATPAGAFTVIRGNRFEKGSQPVDPGNARPNVLVGHFPLQGTGSNDQYVVYGNVFEDNAQESLFQGEGNIALYSNLFVNRHGDGMRIQPHNHLPRTVSIFGNTVVVSGVGISVAGGEPGYRRYVANNAIFAEEPLRADATGINYTAPLDRAPMELLAPLASTAERDFAPRPGALRGGERIPAALHALPDWDRDLLGRERTEAVLGACVAPTQRDAGRRCR